MRKYYDTSLVCPSCQAPSQSGFSELADNARFEVPESIGDGWYACKNENCRAEFNTNYIDVDGVGKIPLYRQVELNRIESEYTDWISGFPKGKHIITWPWEDVRMIPVAVSEALLNNPNHKIMILGNYNKEHELVSVKSLINNLIYFDESEKTGFKFSVDKKDLKKQLIKKRDVVITKRRKYSSGKVYPDDVSLDTITKTRNRWIKYLYDNEGPGCIKEISVNDSLIASPKKFPDAIDNINGKWILKFNTGEQRRIGKNNNIQYNISWLNEIASNKDNIQHVKDSIIIQEVSGIGNEYPDNNATLYVLKPSKEIFENNQQEIFKTIKRFNPDLLIIPDTDVYVRDIRYASGGSSYNLCELINNSDIPVIMFSTDTESRQYYNLSGNKNIFNPAEIIVHSLDCHDVLSKCDNSCNNINKSFYSSGNDFKSIKSKTDIIYKSVNIDLGEAWNQLSLKKRDFLDEYRFILKLMSSPLDPLNLKSRDNITYNVVFSRLRQAVRDNEISSDIVDELKESIDSKYCGNNNPILNEFISSAKSYLAKKIQYAENDGIKKNQRHVIFIVGNKYEADSFSEILNDYEITPNMADVATWWDLSNYIDEDNAKFTQIISSVYPSQKYRLSECNVESILFINNEKNLSNIKRIIQKRLQDYVVRPVVIPKDITSVPVILQENLPLIYGISPEEELKEIFEDDEDELTVIHQYGYSSEYHADNKENNTTITDTESGSTTILESGTDAILVINPEKQGLFIPPDSSMMIVVGDLFDDVRLDSAMKTSDLKKILLKKRLIISRLDVYYSFRSTFFNYMISHQSKIMFDIDNKSYTYKQLHLMSTLWIKYIWIAIENYSEKNNVGINNAKDDIIEILSKSIPKDPITVRLWLRDGTKMSADDNDYFLYKTERPSSHNDMNKIYDALNQLVPDYDVEDLNLSFKSVLMIQKLRNWILKPKYSKNENNVINKNTIDKIHEDLKIEFRKLKRNAALFDVDDVKKITLSKNVPSLKIINDHVDYIKY